MTKWVVSLLSEKSTCDIHKHIEKEMIRTHVFVMSYMLKLLLNESFWRLNEDKSGEIYSICISTFLHCSHTPMNIYCMCFLAVFPNHCSRKPWQNPTTIRQAKMSAPEFWMVLICFLYECWGSGGTPWPAVSVLSITLQTGGQRTGYSL